MSGLLGFGRVRTDKTCKILQTGRWCGTLPGIWALTIDFWLTHVLSQNFVFLFFYFSVAVLPLRVNNEIRFDLSLSYFGRIELASCLPRRQNAMRPVATENFPLLVGKFDRISRGICNKIRDLLTTLALPEFRVIGALITYVFFF
ncbi:hypothetical protein BDV41DRAFT_237471 [Aspergillus transmontanensis]|uniref:Uncharacterized protein n=1 Tax=Aspergillus transmontanensis TaxID=1034304 RepID=A0A5N6WF69_9EURO|nr:hypothetical protein BDV41DRAFT_237471 [Aspergillus transmontanensis]